MSIHSKNTRKGIGVDKIEAKMAMEELSMMLIYLLHFTERDRMADPNSKYAWEDYDFDVLNRLGEKEYISQGFHRSKSMYITKEGKRTYGKVQRDRLVNKVKNV